LHPIRQTDRHTHTHTYSVELPGRGIGPSQWPLPDNTKGDSNQNSQKTSVRNPRLRPRGRPVGCNKISSNLNLRLAVRKTAASDFCSTYLGVNISLLKLRSLTKRGEDIPEMTLSHRLLVASLSITAPTVSPNVDKTCDILRMVSKT